MFFWTVQIFEFLPLWIFQHFPTPLNFKPHFIEHRAINFKVSEKTQKAFKNSLIFPTFVHDSSLLLSTTTSTLNGNVRFHLSRLVFDGNLFSLMRGFDCHLRYSIDVCRNSEFPSISFAFYCTNILFSPLGDGEKLLSIFNISFPKQWFYYHFLACSFFSFDFGLNLFFFICYRLLSFWVKELRKRKYNEIFWIEKFFLGDWHEVKFLVY